MTQRLFDHVASTLSALDLEIIRHVPPGGNWTNIPPSVPSQRIHQIREMADERGGVVRTTYYGRLHPARPSYTIATYFNRPGNGCNIHPQQDRTLSIREAARLQSFPDRIRFEGGQGARRKQIGNAVPVLLARALGSIFPSGCSVVDLFAGAGGLSLGLALAGHKVVVASDNDSTVLAVHKNFHSDTAHIEGDITDRKVQRAIVRKSGKAELVVGGPPCQGWSYAGWHAHEDPRNRLVWSFIDVVNAIRPRWFVMENVQGLLWMAKGAALAAIKEEFSRHYSVTHVVLNAADYGVPQLRNRVFVIGSAKGAPPPAPTPLFPNGDLFLPPYISVQQAIGDLPPLEPGQGADDIDWQPPQGVSAYQLWSRDQISFDDMRDRLLVESRRQAQSQAIASVCA